MKNTGCFIFLILLISNTGYAQVYLKGEFIGSSGYRDENNQKVGNAKGSAQVYQAGVNIPFAIRMDEQERVTGWGIALTGSYTSLHNRNTSARITPNEILNGQLSLSHIRPVSEKWSLLAVAGVGLYTSHANFSRFSGRNIMGHGGALFIYHWKPNLDVGGGLVMNTSFGYPMVFPGLYFSWRLEGRYEVNVEMVNAMELSAGMQLNDYLKLKLVGEFNGALALEKIGDKNMMFTHQYIITGLQPEFRLGKSLSLPVTVGITAERAAYYEERTLKAFFKGFGREYDPHFSVAPYVGVGLKYGF